jgi:hypothetical protein
MKLAVFWNVAQCSLVVIYRCFREAYCFHLQVDGNILMMEKVSASETSVSI